MKSIKKLLVFILVFLSFILVVDARAGGGGHSGGTGLRPAHQLRVLRGQ